jgi:hypothetical protein
MPVKLLLKEESPVVDCHCTSDLEMHHDIVDHPKVTGNIILDTCIVPPKEDKLNLADMAKSCQLLKKD